MTARHGTRGTPSGFRPTSGLVRAALFNHLGGRVTGARVLDLFAGTGGLGVEALRRDAARVVFVERDAQLALAIRSQLAKETFTHRAEVWRRDAIVAIRELARTRRQFELIFMDPPYGEGWIPRALRVLVQTDILAPGGIVIAEGHWRDRPPSEPELVCSREARYGETMLWYFERRKGGHEG